MRVQFFSSPSRRTLAALALAVIWLASSTPFAAGQGFLVEPDSPRQLPRYVVVPIRPVPPLPPPRVEATPYRIDAISVDAAIRDDVAQVSVSQTFKNVGKSTIEAAFVFPLPYDGAVDSMTLLVDGKEFAAKLLDAKEARTKYEEIVRKNLDPALLEWVGTGLFQTSVFPIPAGETRTVSISYSQLLRTRDGLTEFLFPLSCAKYSTNPVGKVSFNVAISGDVELKNVYSPTFDLTINRNGKNAATATCVLENKVPANDFRLFFDRNADELSAKIQSYRPNDAEDGYFLLLAAPKIVEEERAPLPKTILFALDVSGSMSGEKIAQARESLKFVLSRLRDGDRFNVVLFGTDVRSFKDGLLTADAETRAEALAFVDSVRASGSTNIEGGLKTAFGRIAKDDSANPKYLLFLSDGEPTVGECNEMKLAEIARKENVSNARFFSFGVGYDVNSRLLDRFVRDGRGQGEYVKPDENIEERVAALYNRVESPIFSDVEFEFSLKNDAAAQYFTNFVYPNGKTDVFAGEQLVVVGRYSKPGEIVVKARGKVGEKDVEFSFDGALTEKSDDATFSFVERIWAARRVGEIVDKLDLDGPNEELLNELLELSKKHGILTPYTSFLADDSVALNAADNAARASRNVDVLASQTSNASGFGQRSLKQSFKRAANLAVSDAASDDAFEMESSAAFDAGGASGGSSSLAFRARGSAPRQLSRTRSGVATNAPVLAAPVPAAAPIPRRSSPDAAVRNVAGKTFFFKEGRWIDSSIDETLEKSQTSVEITQFDAQYFELVEQFGDEIAPFLAFSEPTTLNFRGQIYRIDPPNDSK